MTFLSFKNQYLTLQILKRYSDTGNLEKKYINIFYFRFNKIWDSGGQKMLKWTKKHLTKFEVISTKPKTYEKELGELSKMIL